MYISADAVNACLGTILLKAVELKEGRIFQARTTESTIHTGNQIIKENDIREFQKDQCAKV